ncbi:hypothetical protein H4S01_001303 [Coemansia sp. RSA 2610]|nr:hypothetical protein IWW54_005999 [Coemansia sp. RSA 2705]KAJ2304633.1 hypothetical protein IWW52_006566 [Coemansia sp. RSA 2704]KAJ2368937.1 hypothetical protein H4S01_001303 [Coemansia sp. RSA 2610]
MATRNSIFHRRSRPPLLPSPQSQAQSQAQSLPPASRHAQPPGADADAAPCISCEDRVDQNSDELELRYALSQELPFAHCFFTPDTHEFLWTTSPAITERPVTVAAEPITCASEASKYCPTTPEVMMSIVENLRMSYRTDVCWAVIPLERRLPEIRDFIWRLFDGTKVDLWTGLACLVLLKRFRYLQPQCHDAPYEAPYTLFLGIFLLAVEQCVRADNPGVLTLPSIARILDTWYQPDDLARIRLDTFFQLDCCAWISKEDIVNHAAHNMFDVYNIDTSYHHYEQRQHMRMLVAAEERRREEDRQRLIARLERYMYRTPHDSIGSWNTNTMYCTESRFLFRHLPWFPGMVTPIHVTARSEQARFYAADRERGPVFSPLLPALRSRVSSSTN